MAHTHEHWRRLYRVCDPKERLHINELDLFVERPDSVARKIATSLEGGFDEQGKWIICGSVGTGKSTELTQLAALLHDHYFVIGVDLWRASARIDEISAAEILFCIGAAAIRMAENRFGHSISADTQKHLISSFSGLVDERHGIKVADLVEGVTLMAFDLLAPGTGSAVKSGLKAARAVTGSPTVPVGRAKLGGLTKPVKDGDPSVEMLVWAVDQILTELGESVRAPLVLVDGLDKLTKIDSIRDLFATSRLLAKPRVPVVYTGPVTLMLAAEWAAAGNYFDRARLSNLVVAEPVSASRRATPGQVESGRAAARGVIEHRCRKADVGIDDVFTTEAVGLLISKSGGLTRQLLQLVREAAKFAGMAECAVVDEELAQRACDELRKEFEITMTGTRREELEYVASHGEPRGGDVSNEMLLWNYAIPYANGEMWFAPNPLIDLREA